MYELVKLTENSYYIDSPSKIGLIKLNEREVCLIDSGNNKDTAKKIKKILDSNSWELKAIYNTHSHADHIGGNNYLQKQTNCKIYSPLIEAGFTNNTILEPTFLFSATPPKELKHKFLMAENSKVEILNEKNLVEQLEIITLMGHSFNMVGFKTKNDVIYLADALSSTEILDKYKIVFIHNVGEHIKTLEKIKGLKAKIFVPSHTLVSDNISNLAQYNINKVFEVSKKILDICKEEKTIEEVLQTIFADFNLSINFEQYFLLKSTISSYLTWLKETNKIECFFDNNRLLWKGKR